MANELKALLSIITESVAVAERYIPQRQNLPQGEPIDPELRNSIVALEAACSQLCSLIARPGDTLANKCFAFYEPACIQAVLTAKVPDILEESPSGIHISELERRTGVDGVKLGRVLRLLAARHLFQEVSANTFANNYLSKHLLSNNPLSSFALHITDECFKSSTYLSDILNDPKVTSSTSPADAAFCKYFKFDGTPFDYLAGSAPEQVMRASRFGVAMMGWGNVVEANAVVYDFPWGKLPEGTTVCDVGGGVGNITIQLAKSYPALHLILQDVPEQLRMAEEKVWPEQCPSAISEHRIEFIPVDFLQESPKQNCDIYYLKNILHDWNDSDCMKILRSVKNAMSSSSRLLIHEFIVQPGYRIPVDEAKFTQAPEPLLPNYGEGRIRQHTLDVHMMTQLNGKERSLDGFIALGEATGLKFSKLWDTGEMGLVEFTKA